MIRFWENAFFVFIPTAPQFINRENPVFSLRNGNHLLNSIAKSQLPNLG